MKKLIHIINAYILCLKFNDKLRKNFFNIIFSILNMYSLLNFKENFQNTNFDNILNEQNNNIVNSNRHYINIKNNYLLDTQNNYDKLVNLINEYNFLTNNYKKIQINENLIRHYYSIIDNNKLNQLNQQIKDIFETQKSNYSHFINYINFLNGS